MTKAAYLRLQANVANPEKARKRRAPVLPERSIQRAIEDYLTVELGPEGLGWFRMNSGSAFKPAYGDNPYGPAEMQRIKLAPAGTADLLAIVPALRACVVPRLPPSPNGYYFAAIPMWIEVKSPEGKTDKVRNARQLGFLLAMEERGCIAIRAESLEDVKKVLPPRGAR